MEPGDVLMMEGFGLQDAMSALEVRHRRADPPAF